MSADIGLGHVGAGEGAALAPAQHRRDQRRIGDQYRHGAVPSRFLAACESAVRFGSKDLKYYGVLLIHFFLINIAQAHENQTIAMTGEPSMAHDDYETIELALLPPTLPGHPRGPIDPGTWLSQDHLSGNWYGLRGQLSDQGIMIESSIVADGSKNLKGGENVHGETFRHLYDLNVTFDLEQLLGWQGATVFLDFYNQHGADGSEDTGDIQAYSNVDAPDRTQLAEVWIQQVLIEESLEIKFGKMDSNADFAYVDNGGEFINSSAGFSPTIALLTYPETAVGVVLFSNPGENLSANFGVYDGAAQEGITTGTRGFSTWFDSSPSDLLLIGEVAVTWDDDNLPGRIGVGGWRHTGRFDKFDGGAEHGTNGLYFVCDKALSKENPDDPEDDQGTSFFVQYGLADQDVMEIE